MRIEAQFEKFIFELLKTINLDSKMILEPAHKGVDIEINFNSNLYGIELKVYRTRRVPISTIRNSLIQLQYNIIKNQYKGGILILTSNIEPSIRTELKHEFNIELIDRGILISLTNGKVNLRKELERLLLQVSQSGEEDIYDGIYPVDENFKIRLVAMTI